MSLVMEISLIPDILDITTYQNVSVGNALLCNVLSEIYQDGIVSNLRNGDWYNYVLTCKTRNWFPNAISILKSLHINNRIKDRPPRLNTFQFDDEHWCLEAISLASTHSLQGIICAQAVFNRIGVHPKLTCISGLHATPWWNNRIRSIRVNHNLADYQQHLEPIIMCSNSLMIIDRFLDPSETRYKRLITLIESICSGGYVPRIELHRVEYRGNNRGDVRTHVYWENRFRMGLSTLSPTFKRNIEVFVWDHFHDRYLITDIIGIHSGSGFDIKNNKPATRWSKLDNSARDDMQFEFDPASPIHILKHRFHI